MYCPKCRSEYVEGIAVCIECNEELVNELPPEIEKQPSNKSLFVVFNSNIEKWLKIGGFIYIILGVSYDILRQLRAQSSISTNTPMFYFVLTSCFFILERILWGLFYYGLGRIIEILREGFTNEK